MRQLLTPRWLLRHALVLAAVVAFGLLARWQYGRAVGGNVLSWAYALEWPLFAGFVVALWVRLVREQLHTGRPDTPPRQALAPITRPAGGGRVGGSGGAAAGDEDDPELAAYNRYLAWLAANPDRRPSDYPG